MLTVTLPILAVFWLLRDQTFKPYKRMTTNANFSAVQNFIKTLIVPQHKWSLSKAVTFGPKMFGLYREVAA